MQMPGNDELRAIDAVLDYLVIDETMDFRDRRLAGHIYNHLYTLAKWRGRDVSDWPKPITKPKPAA